MDGKIFTPEKLEKAKPAVTVIHTCSKDKISLIILKKGVFLSKHTSPVPAQLWVVKGKVKYTQHDVETIIEELSSKDIPQKEFHEVLALEDSHCILIQDYFLT